MARSTIRTAAVLLLVTVLACGLGGAVTAEPAVAALGSMAGHREQVLRFLGWSWTGLPFVLLTVLFLLRSRVGGVGRRVALYLLVVWVGSSSTLLPPRGSSGEERFGRAFGDSRPLSFGWAAGLLPVFAMLFILLIAVLLTKWMPREVSKAYLNRLSKVLGVVWVVLLAAGLTVALTAPMP